MWNRVLAGALLWPMAAALGMQAPELRRMADAGQLSDLRWPDFSDYRLHVKNFYEPAGYALSWQRDGQPTAQALSVISTLGRADEKGLNPEDYDAPRWPARVMRLRQSPSSEEQARFDMAITISVMRYISDLHIGKVNPRFFNFGLDVGEKKYSLPDLLRQRLVDAIDVPGILDQVEPRFAAYRKAREALQQYTQ